MKNVQALQAAVPVTADGVDSDNVSVLCLTCVYDVIYYVLFSALVGPTVVETSVFALSDHKRH